MEPGIPDMLPWQQPVMQRALALKREQRLPHAVLLETPGDYQMDQLARFLPMLLLCDQPDGELPCMQCKACRMMSAGSYSDFSLVTLEPDPKSKKLSKNIKIEQIRKLIHELSLTPKFDRLKPGVIYPAELMSQASANALLKTLEEPAPGVLLILVTRHPGRIPVTLRSRCQSWVIDPPNEEVAREWLALQDMNSAAATQYLQYADGDPLLAQQLEQCDFAAQVDAFKTRFAAFLRAEQSVSELVSNMVSSEGDIVRRLISMTLRAYCHKACGVDSGKSGAARARVRDLLDLQRRAQRQLQVEENNLDFQLQLEDVLISLKQILTRRLS